MREYPNSTTMGLLQLSIIVAASVASGWAAIRALAPSPKPTRPPVVSLPPSDAESELLEKLRDSLLDPRETIEQAGQLDAERLLGPVLKQQRELSARVALLEEEREATQKLLTEVSNAARDVIKSIQILNKRLDRLVAKQERLRAENLLLLTEQTRLAQEVDRLASRSGVKKATVSSEASRKRFVEPKTGPFGEPIRERSDLQYRDPFK